MAIHTPQELRALLPRGRRLLGLDLGSKTIGLAISDPGLVVASPITTIRRTKFTEDARQLGRIIAEREVGGLVLGLPINMDGSEGPSATSARQFATNLLARADLLGGEPEITFWDERLSTSAVTRMMIEADMTRKRRAEVVDKMAAAYILQGCLDLLSRPAPDDDDRDR
ncbi:MAG: Holliday junction resolvase RuvX [Azospirillaceae bacterium]|nr:Holliday junction resolvase RuvX [Azospirillaceae bacterium]